MIIIDGLITPSVAAKAPRKPSIFPPINVDKLTAISQCTPGAIAVNLSTFIGGKIDGFTIVLSCNIFSIFN